MTDNFFNDRTVDTSAMKGGGTSPGGFKTPFKETVKVDQPQVTEKKKSHILLWFLALVVLSNIDAADSALWVLAMEITVWVFVVKAIKGIVRFFKT